MSKNLKILTGAVIFIIAISVIYYFFLFPSKEQKDARCHKLGEKIAEDWERLHCHTPCTVKLLRTTHNIERSSCFGEFDVFMDTQWDDWSELYILDLSNGNLVNTENIGYLMYSNEYARENPDEDVFGYENFREYFEEKYPGYYQMADETFGVDGDFKEEYRRYYNPDNLHPADLDPETINFESD